MFLGDPPPGAQALAAAKSWHSLLCPAPGCWSSTLPGLFPRSHTKSCRGVDGDHWGIIGGSLDFVGWILDELWVIFGFYRFYLATIWDWTHRNRGFRRWLSCFRDVFLVFRYLLGWWRCSYTRYFVRCQAGYQGFDECACICLLHLRFGHVFKGGNDSQPPKSTNKVSSFRKGKVFENFTLRNINYMEITIHRSIMELTGAMAFI